MRAKNAIVACPAHAHKIWTQSGTQSVRVVQWRKIKDCTAAVADLEVAGAHWPRRRPLNGRLRDRDIAKRQYLFKCKS